MAITFPASPVNGQTHTENGQIFVFDSTRGYWLLKKQDQIVASTSRSTFVATAGQTVHNVSYDPSASVIVSVNGVMLNPQDVTATNGTSITFDTALTLSDEVDIVFHQPTASNLIRQDISDPMATESYVQTYVTNNSSAGATTSYANTAAFPSSGNTVGDLAFAQDTNTLYVWDGSEWDRISSGNDESPIIINEPPTTHTLSSDGTPSTVTMVAEDPEGFDISYGIAYKTAGNALPNQLASATTVNANGEFTFTPTSNTSNAGSFRARLSASDGAKTTNRFVDFALPHISWNNVVFHMSVNESNNLVDISEATNSPHTITSYGNAAASTNYTKYNTKSVYLDGSGDYLRADTVLDGFTGVNDAITIEAWVYNVSFGGDSTFWFGLNRASDGQNTLLLGYKEFWINDVNVGDYSTIMSANQWHHFAYVYENGSHNVYLDGTEVYSKTNTTLSTSLSNCVFGVGAEFDSVNGGSPGNYINGYIENLQVLNTKKYTANFTPPSVAFSRYSQ